MPNYWTIENTKKNPEGNPLDSLQIQQTSTGGYQLVAVLSTNETALEFDNVTWDDEIWNIHLDAPLIPGKNGKGHWHLHRKSGPDTGGQDGDFTAQAGSGLGEEPGDAASHAKA